MKRRRLLQSLGVLGIAGLTTGTYCGNKWNLFNSNTSLGLLDEKSDLIKTLANLIIPETNSPGAADCDVHNYIILMVKDCTDRRSQINFVEGLKELESYALQETGTEFNLCDSSEQVSILEEFERRGGSLPGLLGKAKNKFLGQSFFSLLKKYTVIGYFTSKEGANQALAYLPVPGKRIACADLSTYPKSWATQ